VLFFDDILFYFLSHLRSVRIYLDVFAIVFVKRSGRFRHITLAAGSWSKRAEPDIKLFLIDWLVCCILVIFLFSSICVSWTGEIWFDRMFCVCKYSNRRFCAVQLRDFVQLGEAYLAQEVFRSTDYEGTQCQS
jgi:hypothetical protein